MREPDWATSDGRVKLYCGDAIEVLACLEVDRIIVDQAAAGLSPQPRVRMRRYAAHCEGRSS